MLTNKLHRIDDNIFADSAIGRMLTSAHSQIEKRFLDGGTVLLSIMDVINRLIVSLDELTGALDDKTTAETAGGILKTAGELKKLPALEADRLTNLGSLAEASGMMHSHVEDMQETMRYLRTFAITVKITGAGLAEFAGFAEEILERINSGTDEVKRFAADLKDLDSQLQNARGFSGTIVGEYEKTVPQIVEDLSRNASKIGDHNKRLATLAKDVSVLARRVQTKIAAVLSALQIGDITRQRIEHVQESFGILEDFSRNHPDRDLTPLHNVICHMATAHMDEMVADFQRESRNVVANIASFVDDAEQILRVRDAMVQENDGGDRNFLQTLEASVQSACALVSRVKTSSQDADSVARSTTATAQKLLTEIEIIRAIKTDIHYMALNTNLRCSRLGEEGRSINVVTAELRIYAGKLEASADSVVEHLQGLETASLALSANDHLSSENIDLPLNKALSTIRDAGALMEKNLSDLSTEGQEVFNQVSRATSTLDFESELGDLLLQCADEFATLAGEEIADIGELGDLVDEIGAAIYRRYTMAPERTIHQQFLQGTTAAAPIVVETAPATDEDLFEDALF